MVSKIEKNVSNIIENSESKLSTKLFYCFNWVSDVQPVFVLESQEPKQMENQISNIKFFNATPEHIDNAIKVAAEAFGVYNISKELYENRFKSDMNCRHSQLRVGVMDSTVVATIRLYWRTFCVGKASIPMVIIGEVAVAKAQQGSGIGHSLMRNTIEYLKGQGVLLAWLGGRPSFYNQFGFSLVTESRLMIDVKSALTFNDISQKALNTSPEDLIKDNQWCNLWDKFCEGCYSRFHRTHGFATWLLQDRNIGFANGTTSISLYENQQLIGYILAQQLGKNIFIHELAWKTGNVDSVGFLLKSVAKKFIDCEDIILGGPKRPDLRKWLASNKIKWRYEELTSFPMSLILDVCGLLKALYPNWQTTITEIENPKPLAMIDPKGSAVLIEWQSGEIKILPIFELPRNVIILNIDQGQLIKLLLGFCSAEDLSLGARLGLSQVDSDFLMAVFPNSSGFLGDLERA